MLLLLLLSTQFVGIGRHVHIVGRHVVRRNVLLDEIHERLGGGSHGASSRRRRRRRSGTSKEGVAAGVGLTAHQTPQAGRWTQKAGSRRLRTLLDGQGRGSGKGAVTAKVETGVVGILRRGDSGSARTEGS